MFLTSILFATLLVSTAIAQNQTCYWPNGDVAANLRPCTQFAVGGDAPCCFVRFPFPSPLILPMLYMHTTLTQLRARDKTSVLQTAIA